jgi:LDH2 family malate/lactate/ureidoglycolate dehydrogenase
MNGLLMPVGGYKGVGIAVMVDLLTAALSQGTFPNIGRIENESKPTDACHFFMPRDIENLLPKEALYARLAEYTRLLKASVSRKACPKYSCPGKSSGAPNRNAAGKYPPVSENHRRT